MTFGTSKLMAVRGNWAIFPIQIDQVLELISVALDPMSGCHSCVVNEAAPNSDPAGLQLGGADRVAR